MIFHDRKHAGTLLAAKLLQYRSEDPLILALPRGGVPVAVEVSQRLEAPWNVLMVRKIGSPFQRELALGAVCEEDEAFLNDDLFIQLGLTNEDLVNLIRVEREDIHEKVAMYRRDRPLENVKGRTVIVVDDGLATGSTAISAVRYLRKRGAGKIIVAVPIAAASSGRIVRQEADAVITVEEREDLFAVGPWYEDFTQVSDEEVMDLLHPHPSQASFPRKDVEIDVDGIFLKGNLTSVPQMKGLILFAHGSGSSRLSPRNQMVAHSLNLAGFGTLLFDLLTSEEAEERENVFNIDLLSHRLVVATHFVRRLVDYQDLPIGLFGASTGAGASLVAAALLAEEKNPPFAIVSRGGRPDLAGSFLERVRSPTLLIVGERDSLVWRLNEEADRRLKTGELVQIDGATHLFEEEGALEQVADHAISWFSRYCPENRHVKRVSVPKSKTRQFSK